MRKDCMARELTVEVVVGVFLVLVFLGMGLFTIILSGGALRRSQEQVVMLFGNVMGLRAGDGIVVRGMPVGEVEDLELTDRGVRVEGRIKEGLDLREDYRVTIVQTSILGGRYVQIDEGSAAAPPLPRDTVLEGDDPVDLMEDAAELISRLRAAFVDGGVIEDLQTASSQLRTIAERIGEGKGTLGRLLSADDTLYRDLSASVASLKRITERLESGQGMVGKLLSDDETMYEDLSAAVAALRDISRRIEQGEGTLGKLVRDDTLYEDVRGLVNQTQSAVDDIRETSPVVTFTSIFFGAF